MVLLVGVEPTHELFLRQSPTTNWATGVEFDSPARTRTWSHLSQIQMCCQLHHRAIDAETGFEPVISWFRAMRLAIRPLGNKWLPQ